jgi:pilus assembly protein CpaB
VLRRVQPVASLAEAESPANDPGPQPAAPPFVDRRQGDRRGIDALRAEALQNLISRVEDKNFGGLRNQVQWRPKIKPTRMALLAVAVIAGGLAAFLAVQRDPPAAPATEPEPVVEVVPEPRTQILVAREPIAIGQRLTAASVGWAEWPQSALVPEYVDIANAPEAITEVEGAVARTDFVPGEPIREARLAPDGQGFLSTVIGSGKRAVSVAVSAETASGGFITPTDRVDVVLTRASERGHYSETILTNVRILAINHRTGAPQPVSDAPPEEPELFGGNVLATLELSPVESEVVINAATVGRLSLVLRPAEAEEAESAPLSGDQAIRMTSPFWTK